jgi:ribonuclease G
VLSIKPKGFGVIVRTVAHDKKVAELDRDMQQLHKRWLDLCKSIRKADYPSRVLSELNRASSILRDIFDDSFTGIHVDDNNMAGEVNDYLDQIASDKKAIVKLFNSETPIFERFGIERQIKTSFGRTVSMSRGAYLIIEHTEALHVIDVNSGNRSNKAKNQEDTALEVNLIAATEIARQLRLRDMGGIIVIDFIDMIRSENRRKLFDHFREEMNADRAKHKILPPSKIGLIQMTRQRVRPEMEIKTMEPNPNKDGEVEAPIVLLDRIEADVERIVNHVKHSKKKIRLHAHPFVAAYLVQGVKSVRFQWYLKHKKWITVIPRDAYTYLHYRFFDKNGKVIHL